MLWIATVAVGAPVRAQADHDRNHIQQVMAGANGNTSIQFVELRMLDDLQMCQGTAASFDPDTLTDLKCAPTGPGASLLFFDRSGQQVAEFDFPHNTAVGEKGRSILIATEAFAALPGAPAPDFIMPPHVVPESGQVCYKSRPGTFLFVNNCLHYGSFSNDNFGAPAPALPTSGLSSLIRIAEHENPNNSADFVLGTPAPRNNAGATGTVNVTPASSLAAAILPVSRSVRVNATATAFATIINGGNTLATGCGISRTTNIPASFEFQATDPRDNHAIGAPNAPVDIPGRSVQTFIISLTPSAPIQPTDVALNFDCSNTQPAPATVGLNTLLLSASTAPVPDIVALAATLANDGIVNVPGENGMGLFGVATSNVGARGTITATADTGGAALPVTLSICQTIPTNGTCLSPAGPSVTLDIEAAGTPTFVVFVAGHGNIPFDPASNRVFVRFTDGANVTRGATSTAVRTQ
jgi:hypothetical protein